MIIQFNNVVPNPMKADEFSEESAWSHQVDIDTNLRYFLKSGSGRGKSTFCAFIMGLRSDFSGEIIIDGRAQKQITLNEWSDLRAKRLAFLAQDMRLFPNMTVRENLLIKNRLTDYASEKELIDQLGLFELDQKVNQKAGTLSLGQQQRVALIRSLAQPFDFLIMDEPFSHIDDANIEIALELIKQSCIKENAGYLLTTLGSDYGITIDKVINL